MSIGGGGLYIRSDKKEKGESALCIVISLWVTIQQCNTNTVKS